MMSLRLLGFMVSVALSVPAVIAAQSKTSADVPPATAPVPGRAKNLDATGLALKGYDPVAYFTAGAPTKGLAAFAARHDGATYHFASAANREAFIAQPERYLPQYGGFCAMGVAGNAKFDIDPEAWRVEDGKLYLNKNKPTQAYWRLRMSDNIAKADRYWPTLGAQ